MQEKSRNYHIIILTISDSDIQFYYMTLLIRAHNTQYIINQSYFKMLQGLAMNTYYIPENKTTLLQKFSKRDCRQTSLDRSTESQSEAQHDKKRMVLNTLSNNTTYDIYSYPERVLYGNPNNAKYKIQLCRNFMNYGNCPYGDRCQYAHGTQELRYTNQSGVCEFIQNPQTLTGNEKYKTKPCREFFRKEYCLYGQTCNYLHKKEPKTQKTKIKDQGFAEIILNKRQQSRLLELLGYVKACTQQFQ